MATIEETFIRLGKSKFRSSFHLNEQQKAYIREKGWEVIEDHARDFVQSRLSPSFIPNDGKQTPMKGHPVFIAQHAIACCCRGCLNKWYHVPKGVALTPLQQIKIVNLIMAWLHREMGDKE